MRYLIDTNILVMFVTKEFELTKDVQTLLDDYENTFYICSESIKEFVHLMQHNKIKPSKGMVVLDVFDFVENQLGFIVKYVKKEHLKRLAKLETFKEHTDPSDRLIIAMALTEEIPVISSDSYFRYYKKQGLDLIFNHK